VTLPANPKGDLRFDEADQSWNVRCPQCGHWGEIDDDQLHGRISTDHSGGAENNGCACGCTFHETRDWSVTADRV